MASPAKAAVILAGGDGVRLRAFTRAISGEDRPKQFCRLLGSRTLLGATRERLSLLVAADDTLCVVTRHHDRFFTEELNDLDERQLVVQPANRGTGAAIAYALARVCALRGSDRTVGFFPSDHHYTDNFAFRRAVTSAYAAAAADHHRVFLIGARADRPETDYGWIQPGPVLPLPASARTGQSLRTVLGFVEKPSEAEACRLLTMGGLWNTFVVVGHVRALRELLHAGAPGLYEPFEHVAAQPDAETERQLAEDWYGVLRPVDFSREILTPQADRLGLVSLQGAGWTDLGQPARVLDVMASHGLAGPRDLAV
jgi:mannose-1-phosphate guanylyltransferase